jgi:hypothetical protein
VLDLAFEDDGSEQRSYFERESKRLKETLDTFDDYGIPDEQEAFSTYRDYY